MLTPDRLAEIRALIASDRYPATLAVDLLDEVDRLQDGLYAIITISGQSREICRVCLLLRARLRGSHGRGCWVGALLSGSTERRVMSCRSMSGDGPDEQQRAAEAP